MDDPAEGFFHGREYPGRYGDICRNDPSVLRVYMVKFKC
jgi:hypothetical protein